MEGIFDPKMLGDVLAMRMGRIGRGHGARLHTRSARCADARPLHAVRRLFALTVARVLCGIAHMQTDEGIWYPWGGTRAVPEALVKLATNWGSSSARVSEIAENSGAMAAK